MASICLPKTIGDGRLDSIVRVLTLIRTLPPKESLRLDWKRTVSFTPAGYAILACITDCIIEQQRKVNTVFLKKSFKKIPVFVNFLQSNSFTALPLPDLHNSDGPDWILRGKPGIIDGNLTKELKDRFGTSLSEDILYSALLLTNELMVNSVDHSTAERYYFYAGFYKKEFHLGLLDMGISIPAKMEQKYTFSDDQEYLSKATERGTTTRRQRTGGLGLDNISRCLKGFDGRLTIVSRNASMRKYFKLRKTIPYKLKDTLYGTWCFGRFPIK